MSCSVFAIQASPGCAHTAALTSTGLLQSTTAIDWDAQPPVPPQALNWFGLMMSMETPFLSGTTTGAAAHETLLIYRGSPVGNCLDLVFCQLSFPACITTSTAQCPAANRRRIARSGSNCHAPDSGRQLAVDGSEFTSIDLASSCSMLRQTGSGGTSLYYFQLEPQLFPSLRDPRRIRR